MKGVPALKSRGIERLEIGRSFLWNFVGSFNYVFDNVAFGNLIFGEQRDECKFAIKIQINILSIIMKNVPLLQSA